MTLTLLEAACYLSLRGGNAMRLDRSATDTSIPTKGVSKRSSRIYPQIILSSDHREY